MFHVSNLHFLFIVSWFICISAYLYARRPLNLRGFWLLSICSMQFQNYIINLLEEPMATRLDKPHIDAFSQSIRQKPRELLSSLKRSFETVIRLYYLRHSFEALDYFMVQYLSMLAFMAHGAIHASMQRTTLQTLKSTIILAAMGLRDQSASFYTGRMVFKAVRSRMRREEIELIDRFTAQGWPIENQPPPGWRAISSWDWILAASLLIARPLILVNSLKKLESAN